VIGFAFNTRLLLGGFAGEPDSSPGGLNPFGAYAGKTWLWLLLDAHRMLGAQSAELQHFRAYVKLFQDACSRDGRPRRSTQSDWDPSMFSSTECGDSGYVGNASWKELP